MAEFTSDQRSLQKWAWAVRDAMIDSLLLHTCDVKEAAEALIRVSGWDVSAYIMAVLADERGILDD